MSWDLSRLRVGKHYTQVSEPGNPTSEQLPSFTLLFYFLNLDMDLNSGSTGKWYANLHD